MNIDDIKVVGKYKGKPVFKVAEGYFVGVSYITLQRLKPRGKVYYSWVMSNVFGYQGLVKVEDTTDLHAAFIRACNLVQEKQGGLYRSAKWRLQSHSPTKEKMRLAALITLEQASELLEAPPKGTR